MTDSCQILFDKDSCTVVWFCLLSRNSFISIIILMSIINYTIFVFFYNLNLFFYLFVDFSFTSKTLVLNKNCLYHYFNYYLQQFFFSLCSTLEYDFLKFMFFFVIYVFFLYFSFNHFFFFTQLI
jgi:hypothetical protein